MLTSLASLSGDRFHVVFVRLPCISNIFQVSSYARRLPRVAQRNHCRILASNRNEACVHQMTRRGLCVFDNLFSLFGRAPNLVSRPRQRPRPLYLWALSVCVYESVGGDEATDASPLPPQQRGRCSAYPRSHCCYAMKRDDEKVPVLVRRLLEVS